MQLLDLQKNTFLARSGKGRTVRLLAGEAELTQYLFHTKKNFHYFCRHCGVRPFGVGTETPVGKMVGVNLGCLEDLSDEDLCRIPITYVDGRDGRLAPPEHFAHL